MLNFSAVTRVFVAVEPLDLRRSFNGLFGCVQQQLQLDPLSRHLFVFTNRARNRLKVLAWDGSGLRVCAKRLERGRFSWPTGAGGVACLHGEGLVALVSGLEVRAKQNWFRREAGGALPEIPGCLPAPGQPAREVPLAIAVGGDGGVGSGDRNEADGGAPVLCIELAVGGGDLWAGDAGALGW